MRAPSTTLNDVSYRVSNCGLWWFRGQPALGRGGGCALARESREAGLAVCKRPWIQGPPWRDWVGELADAGSQVHRYRHERRPYPRPAGFLSDEAEAFTPAQWRHLPDRFAPGGGWRNRRDGALFNAALADPVVYVDASSGLQAIQHPPRCIMSARRRAEWKHFLATLPVTSGTAGAEAC